jgi:hypothetical protein
MNNILTALMTLLVKHWRPGFILLMGLVVVVGILNLKRFSASSSRLGDDEIDSASLVIEGGSKVERRLRFPIVQSFDEPADVLDTPLSLVPARPKRLPSGALEYPDSLVLARHFVEEAKRLNGGNDDELVEILEFMEREMIETEKRNVKRRANAGPEEAEYYRIFDEISETRSEIAQSIWQRGNDRRERMGERIMERIMERRDHEEIEEWLSAPPAKISTPIEDQTYETLVSGRIDDADGLELIADYLRSRQKEARRQLEALEPLDPQWWADHLEWVEGAAGRLHIPLEAESNDWIQEFVSFWHDVKARRVGRLAEKRSNP